MARSRSRKLGGPAWTYETPKLNKQVERLGLGLLRIQWRVVYESGHKLKKFNFCVLYIMSNP